MPLVVGNWKMELSHKAAVALAKSLKSDVEEHRPVCEIVVCPSFPSLSQVSEVLKGTPLNCGAQDVSAQEKGALTGQVSVTQLGAFVSWCIVGHSETRTYAGDSDRLVAQKAELLLRHGLTPIVCIGETEDERHADETVAKIGSQIQSLLAVLPRVAFLKTIIAYEPIWAIGSGFSPQPDDVAEIMLLIRKMTQHRFDTPAAQRLRILYGGSVKPENVAQYVGGPYADGVLVGGASVHAGQFFDIIKEVEQSFT